MPLFSLSLKLLLSFLQTREKKSKKAAEREVVKRTAYKMYGGITRKKLMAWHGMGYMRF